jgi:hypothetical protein
MKLRHAKQFGWRCRLRKVYSSFAEYLAYDRCFNLSARLGFESAEDAWEANPMVQGSTDPETYRVVENKRASTHCEMEQ